MTNTFSHMENSYSPVKPRYRGPSSVGTSTPVTPRSPPPQAWCLRCPAEPLVGQLGSDPDARFHSHPCTTAPSQNTHTQNHSALGKPAPVLCWSRAPRPLPGSLPLPSGPIGPQSQPLRARPPRRGQGRGPRARRPPGAAHARLCSRGKRRRGAGLGTHGVRAAGTAGFPEAARARLSRAPRHGPGPGPPAAASAPAPASRQPQLSGRGREPAIAPRPAPPLRPGGPAAPSAAGGGAERAAEGRPPGPRGSPLPSPSTASAARHRPPAREGLWGPRPVPVQPVPLGKRLLLPEVQSAPLQRGVRPPCL